MSLCISLFYVILVNHLPEDGFKWWSVIRIIAALQVAVSCTQWGQMSQFESGGGVWEKPPPKTLVLRVCSSLEVSYAEDTFPTALLLISPFSLLSSWIFLFKGLKKNTISSTGYGEALEPWNNHDMVYSIFLVKKRDSQIMSTRKCGSVSPPVKHSQNYRNIFVYFSFLY